jgi:hypothetical protein
MADTEGTNVPVTISSSADTKGFDDTGRAAQGAKEQTDTLKDSVDELKSSLMALVGIAGMIEFWKSSVEGALENERALRAVSVAAESFGQNGAVARQRIEEMADSFSQFAGVAKGEVLEALVNGYKATGDLEQAQKRMVVTQQIALKGNVEYSEAEKVLTQAMFGRIQGLQRLLQHTFEGTSADEKRADMMKYLNEVVAKGAVVIDDQALAVDRAKASWTVLKDQIGKEVTPAVTWLAHAFGSIVDWIKLAGANAGTFFYSLLAQLGAVGKAIGMALKGQIGDAISYVQTEIPKLQAQERAGYVENAALIKDARVKSEKEEEAEISKLQDVKLKLAGAKEIAAATDISDKLLALKQKGLKEDEALTEDHFKKLQIAVQASVEQEQAEIAKVNANEKLTAKQKEDWITAIKADAIKQRQLLAVAYAKFLKTQNDQELKDLLELQQKSLQMEKDKIKFQEAAEKAHLKLVEEEAKSELKVKQAIVSESAGMIGQLFGIEKEAAAAKALINAYLSFTTTAGAYPAPWGTILAALALAVSMAEVANIAAVDIGGGGKKSSSGFDDPVNDAAAREGGRRWARDMIREFSAGTSQGWAEGMMNPTVNQTHNVDNRNINNITFQGAGILDVSSLESVKRLSRALDLAQSTALQQSSISRAALTRRTG